MSTKPTTASEQANFIWIEQDKLNAACSPKGVGTLDKGTLAGLAPDRASDLVEQLKFDYYLALHDEVAELINNFIWKHWAKEARDGRRFELIHPAAAHGEGSAQNVAVELTDIVFFTVSLLHLETSKAVTVVGVWENTWGDDNSWISARRNVDMHVASARNLNGSDRLGNLANNEFLLKMVARFERALAMGFLRDALSHLLSVFAAAGVTRQQAFDLYEQKLAINFARVQRGRKQVGDSLAHRENEGVRA